MKALQYRTIGGPPELVEVPVPAPGPGQVLVRVTAAGVCHSDRFVMELSESDYSARGYPLPMTLGHEAAGVIHSFGEGVATGFCVGDAVVVYGPWGCGRRHNCSLGRENYCTNAAAEGIRPPGLGNHGAMAEYMIVDDVRHLVPLGDLDPVANVSLTDAGLTPYHAIKRSLPKLGAGTYVLVIGAGGLGHLAIQILKSLSGACVFALDINEEKLAMATRVGADFVLISDGTAADHIARITGGRGVNAVFDFVGTTPTMELARSAAGVDADVAIVGVGGGELALRFRGIAFDASVRFPYWGYRNELIEVMELAKSGKVKVEVQTYALDEAPRAYEDLVANTIRGRAVIVP